MDINTLWYLIIGIILAGYLILDGFDLGIGIISLFTPNEKYEYRKQLLAIIGPHWDGNEVWLIVFGGLLFAAFPPVYAALLSAFYSQFFVLLTAFIFRGISVAMRDRHQTKSWNKFWDLCFGLSSFAIVLLFGIAAANLIRGIPLNEKGMMKAGFLMTLNPFAFLVGFFAAALLGLHGAIYAGIHGNSDIRPFIIKMAYTMETFTLILAIPAEIIIFNYAPANVVKNNPLLFAILLILLSGSMVYILWSVMFDRYKTAFFASAILIASVVSLLCLYFFPDLLRCSTDAAKSLTIYNAAATKPAMVVVLIFTVITMPIVIGYSIFVHLKLKPSDLVESGYY